MIEKIREAEIERAREVLGDHYAPLTREGALESGIFCICSAASPWEVATRLIFRLRQMSYPNDSDYRGRVSSLDVLTDKEKVNEAVYGISWRFWHNNRFDSLIDLFGQREGDWWEEIKEADAETRDRYTQKGEEKIKWMNLKTFSFWHLCLGGTRLMPLDIHVRRNLRNEFGIEMPEECVTHTRRRSRTADGKQTHQYVTEEPSRSEYLGIENAARSYFERDERFLKNGETDMALVTTLLWWRGAGRGLQKQQYLGICNGPSAILPYGRDVMEKSCS